MSDVRVTHDSQMHWVYVEQVYEGILDSLALDRGEARALRDALNALDLGDKPTQRAAQNERLRQVWEAQEAKRCAGAPMEPGAQPWTRETIRLLREALESEP